jgi:hypothetical protein
MPFIGKINYIVTLGKDFKMKKKLFSIAIALMMCFSLTMGVTALEGEDIIDVGCCGDHDAFYIHFDLEQIGGCGDVILNSNCSHLINISYTWQETGRSFHPSGGSGPTCTVIHERELIRTRCLRLCGLDSIVPTGQMRDRHLTCGAGIVPK